MEKNNDWCVYDRRSGKLQKWPFHFTLPSSDNNVKNKKNGNR